MAIKNRYEFVLLFDVQNGNPNGDIDEGGAPRIIHETSQGLVTDVCLKRKIRNYVEQVKKDEPGYKILIKADKALNTKFEEAYDATNLPKPTDTKKQVSDHVKTAQKYMMDNYFDVRAIGAVMSTGNCSSGKVTGPVQIVSAISCAPVFVHDLAITRMARTTEERTETGDTEIGHKYIIPYGLYRAEGFISAALAEKTGFNDKDLELLWEALINMFDTDHSAARGKMATRKLYVFKHSKLLGNAPSSMLLDKITVKQKVEIPTCFNDFEINVDEEMPAGVTLIKKFE